MARLPQQHDTRRTARRRASQSPAAGGCDAGDYWAVALGGADGARSRACPFAPANLRPANPAESGREYMTMGNRADQRLALRQRSYCERQMIVVTEDAVIRALDEATPEPTEQKSRKDKTLLQVSLGRGLGLEIPLLDVVMGVAELTAAALKAWRRASESGLHILPVGRSQARELVYVGHPAMPEVYYTIADFHRVTFEHKFAEAITLLMHLGASSIRVEHIHGWSREFSGRLSVPLGQPGMASTAEVGVARGSDSRILFEATLIGGLEPKLPDSLVWYPHEPTWKAIADGRMQFGLHDFTLNVTYSFSGSARAEISLKGQGFGAAPEVGSADALGS